MYQNCVSISLADDTEVKGYINRLTNGLNVAIASFKPTNSKANFVRKIVLVKGVHFYGYHDRYAPFLKVFVADPKHVERTVTALRNGSIMATSYRVFESHLNFKLQFMVDFGLYGCGVLNLAEVSQRALGGDTSDIDPAFFPSTEIKQSTCLLEVDIIAPDILNRRTLQERRMHHHMHIHSQLPPHVPLVPSVRELWDDERSRREAKGLQPEPEMPRDPSSSSRGKGGDWVEEVRWWELLRERIENERLNPAVTLDRRDQAPHWERLYPTLFESVEVVWEKTRRTWKPPAPDPSQPIVVLEQDVEMEDASLSVMPEVNYALLAASQLQNDPVDNNDEAEPESPFDGIDTYVYDVQEPWVFSSICIGRFLKL